MSKEIRWGVLGNALIARACVMPAIEKSQNGRLLALASRHPETATAVVKKHQIPRLLDSYDALIADPDIDAIYIPLPNHLHHPYTLKALAAGKHVLCEKPLATNAAEAKEMATAAARADRHLMEAFMYRFHPRSQTIKQMVDNGELGSLRLIHTAFTFHLSEKELATGNNIRLKPQMGGGALLDVGAYGVSIARWLTGREPTAVQAQAIYGPNGVDLQTIATLRFPGDVLATVEASFIAALQQTVSVVGSQAAIDLPHDAFVPWEKAAVLTLRQQDEETGEIITLPAADEYQLMVEQFAQAILDNSPLPFDIQESVANMAVLDAVAAAARSGKTIQR